MGVNPPRIGIVGRRIQSWYFVKNEHVVMIWSRRCPGRSAAAFVAGSQALPKPLL
jgi:hypothetical protein